MKHDHQPPQRDPELELISRISEAAKRRLPKSSRRLDAESKTRTYKSPTDRYPLASKEQYSGNYEQGLTHLILVGDTVLGISRGFNRKKVDKMGVSSPVESVRISVLPIGTHDVARKHSSATLLEVSPDKLRQPRETGVVVPFESIDIGRAMLADMTGQLDPAVSRDHATVTILADGSIEISDKNSSNGTQVFDEADITQNYDYGGLDQSGREVLGQLMERLQEKPYEWDKESAGIMIVEAQG